MPNDGGPAYPANGEEGMSLCDWFAGLAMQAIIAKATFDTEDQDPPCVVYDGRRIKREDWPDLASLYAYEIAEAMISEKEDEQ